MYPKETVFKRLIKSHCGAILSTASKFGTKPMHKKAIKKRLGIKFEVSKFLELLVCIDF